VVNYSPWRPMALALFIGRRHRARPHTNPVGRRWYPEKTQR
jgi:hypothetical protein